MKAYVYSIRSHQTDKIYIGSTEQLPCNRMAGHRRNYKQWQNGKHGFCTSFEILKFGDAYIEIIVEIEFTSKLELHRIEGENIRKHDCVNKNITGSTRKETNVRYYQANKEQHAEYNTVHYQANKKTILARMAVYRATHKEQITAQQSVPYTCDCGSMCITGNRARHEKTKKHLNLMKLFNPLIPAQEPSVNVIL